MTLIRIIRNWLRYIIKGGLPYKVNRVVITSASGKLLGRIDRNDLGHDIYGGVVIGPSKRSSEMYAAIRNIRRIKTSIT